MGSKTRMSTSCIKRRKNRANLVTSRKVNRRLAHPILVNKTFGSYMGTMIHTMSKLISNGMI